MSEKRISFWCPATQKQVMLDCEIEDLPNTTIQIATPKVCWELRKNGCRFDSLDSECLLGRQIQGNYRKK